MVLAIEGHEIVLSTEVELGASVESASLAVDASFLIERLLVRLEQLGESDNVAGDLALGLRPVEGVVRPWVSDALNEQQRKAVGSALGRNCTFLWGPPGTGKTHTIGAIAAALRSDGQRTLIVSHTNIAVDQAILATDAACPSGRAATSVLRIGVPRDRRLIEREDLLAEHHLRERQRPLAAELAEVARRLRTARRELADLDRSTALLEWFEDARQWRSSVQVEQVSIRHHEAKLQKLEKADVATEAVSLQERAREHRLRRAQVDALVVRAREAGRADVADAARAQLRKEAATLQADTEAFAARHGRRFDDFLAFHSSAAARAEREALAANVRKRRAELRRHVDAMLQVPRAHGAVDNESEGADLLALVDEVIDAVASAQDGRSAPELAAASESTSRSVAELERRVDEIEAELQRMEIALLGEADVLGATLTAGYVRRTLLEQRFDVVVIDEASMAQPPTVWCCAALADRVVVVGDFRQLAPVVIADSPVAEAWLVRDPFDLAGVVEAVDAGRAAPGLVALSEQRRMAPAISSITNSLAYGGLLEDGPGVELDDELDGWLADGPWRDAPVLTVDTESFGSFASLARGAAGWSRANVVSASTAVALAREMLVTDRAARDAGAPARVLIIAPYRPQADLLQTLIDVAGLGADVTAGTVHSFQGSEASVVILDLTAAKPHHRIGLLSAAFDDSNRRLLNVAVTRARRRLLVLGDLEWLRGHAASGAASDLLRAVRASAAEVHAKDVLAEIRDRRPDDQALAIVDSETASGQLRPAIEASHRNVVVFSPRIDDRGITSWGPLLQRRQREIDVVLVTGRPDSAQSAAGHRRLREAGLPIVVKDNIHERAALIDGERVALLDHQPLVGHTRGTIVWWNDRRAAAALDRIIGGTRLIRELEGGGGGCSRCAVPLELAEGDHTDPGWYWKCPRCRSSRQLREWI